MSMELDRAPGTLEFDHVLVRNLRSADLDAIVKIERKSTGRNRRDYYALKVEAALRESSVRISLVAEIDGSVTGFLMGQVYYGEFGRPEPVAIIDSMGVDPDFRRQKVGRALMHQWMTNMRGLNVDTVQTQVDWRQLDLLGFFAKEGFEPAARLCLEYRVPQS